ncbi:MAG: hypothetical protein AAGF85_17835 [Bacteroidota bacterium]
MIALDQLFEDYTQTRFLDINNEQFIYLLHLLPPCLVVMSDGILDRDEWMTLKSLSKILGNELATDDLGSLEKEENLMLIYRAEIRYLLKNRETWQSRFFEALNEYLSTNSASKEFLDDTLDLFKKEEGYSEKEQSTLNTIKSGLGL